AARTAPSSPSSGRRGPRPCPEPGRGTRRRPVRSGPMSQTRGFGMPTAANKPKSAEEEEAEEQEEMERNRLPDDALVDVEEERKKSNSDEVLDRLDRELVGLVPVKTRIKEIADLLVVDRLRTQFGIESTRPTLHMSFTGSPGTG